MKKINWWWRAIGLGILSVGLAGCGGGGGGSGNVRLVNATLTHPSLDLLSSTDASTLISAVATDTVSSYVSVNSGSPSLQVDDATTGTALVGTTLSLNGGFHYAVIAYEVDGVVYTTALQEEISTTPASGTAALRLIDLAVGAGNLNIYVQAAGAAAPTSSSTPTFTLTGPTQATQGTATNFLTVTPNGSYDIWVTGAASATDVRLEIPAAALGDQQIFTAILTPTSGGTLLNAGLLIEQGAYTATHNTNARVRLAAAVSDSATVAAKAGSTSLGSLISQVGSYVLVPAASSTLSVTVNGAAVTAPTGSLTAGTDSTLLVHGDPGTAVATLLADDNHASTTVGNVKVRLVNGLSGSTATSVTWSVAAAQLTTPIPVGTASTYYDSPQTGGVDLQVYSTTTGSAIFSQSNATLQPGQVYSLFLFGDGSSPSKLVLDSVN